MSKLQKYNQIILALAGTILILSVIFGVGGFLLTQMLRNNYTRDEIRTEEQLKADREAGLRTQKATFSPQRRTTRDDNVWQWAAIDVGIKTLEKPEQFANFSKSRRDIYLSGGYGQNSNINILLWNKTNGQSRLVFQDRMQIRETAFWGDDEMEHVVVVAQPTSSNITELFVYNVEAGQLVSVSLNGMIEPELYINNQYELTIDNIILLARDENGNGKYDQKQEVKIPYLLNLQSAELEPLAPMSVFQEAQSILEGGKLDNK